MQNINIRIEKQRIKRPFCLISQLSDIKQSGLFLFSGGEIQTKKTLNI